MCCSMLWYFLTQTLADVRNRAKNLALALNVRGGSETSLPRSFTGGTTLGIPDRAFRQDKLMSRNSCGA